MIYFWTVAAGMALVFAVREALRADDICQKKSDNLFEKLQPKFEAGLGAHPMPVGSHPNEINYLE